MLDLLRKLFQSKSKQDDAEKAPYKVEAPESTIGAVPMTTQYLDEPKAKKAPRKKPTKSNAVANPKAKKVTKKKSN